MTNPDEVKLLPCEFRAVEITSSLTGSGLGEYRIFHGDKCLGEISTKRLLDIFLEATRPPVVTDEVVERVADAMQNAVIRDDEGEFPRLFDLLGFSGENKARTVVRGLARAALASMPAVVSGGQG